MAFFEEVKSKILVEWDKNCTVSSQDIFKNTMYASCLEKMWRVRTKSKSKVCVHGAKCTRAVSARKHCFDNWWCSIYTKAFSQGNATTSNNWRVGAKATHWIPTSVQLRVYRFLSHPHLQWGPRRGFQRQVLLSAVLCLELNLLSFSHGNCFWNLSIALVPGQRGLVVAPSTAEASLPAQLGCLSSHSACTSTGHWVQWGAAFLKVPWEQQEQGTEELIP